MRFWDTRKLICRLFKVIQKVDIEEGKKYGFPRETWGNNMETL